MRKFSTGLVDKLNSKVPSVSGASVSATSIAAVTDTADSFTIAGGDFVVAGFAVGDTIMVSGFHAASNNGIFTIATVTAGTITVVEKSMVSEAAGPSVKIECITGGSLADIFKNGVLKVYSGTQPTTANAAATGTLLATFTNNHGAFTPGNPANGLRFGTSSSGVIAKDANQVWQAIAVSSGTAGWFRLYANAADAGLLSTELPRIDGAIGTSGQQLNMSSTSITSGATYTIDTFTITLATE